MGTIWVFLPVSTYVPSLYSEFRQRNEHNTAGSNIEPR